MESGKKGFVPFSHVLITEVRELTVCRCSHSEGVAALWNGGTMVFIRAILMTTCQVAVYDQTKQMLLQTK